MGFFDFLSSGDKGNPSSAASPYLNQVPGVGQQYYSPYVNRGEQSNQQAGDIYSRLSADPQAFLQQIMQGYKPTEGFKFQSAQALKAANSAAAAGGYSGTSYDQMKRADLANQFASQDMQQYIQNILDFQGVGLNGLQHQGDQGFQASSGLADYLGNAYGNQGQNAYNGKAQSLANRGNMFSGLMGLAGTLGGAAIGGPAGAAVGGKLGSSLGGAGSQGGSQISPQQFSNYASGNNWGRQGWL